MNRMPALQRLLGLVLCCAIAALAYAATPPDAAVRAAAGKLLASLSAEQKTKACFALDDKERVHWAYVPQARRGVSLADMNPTQRALTMELLRAAMSAQGFAKVEGVVKLENVLHELESRPDAPALMRDATLYYVSFFGDPAASKPWAWRFEGHHLSLNFCSITDELGSVTPSFFGANPARVDGGPSDGLRVLAFEEDLGRALFNSLDDKQRGVALLSGDAPRDVLLGPGHDNGLDTTEGLAAAQMTPQQQRALDELLAQFTGNLNAASAAAATQRIHAAGPEHLHFAWIGSAKPGEPHYYRIQGSRFVIECENAQPGANHIHVVWRDMERDFGADLLREHLKGEHGAK